MVNIKDFYDSFYDLGIEFYTGVPNKVLNGFCAYINESTTAYYSSNKDTNKSYKQNKIKHIIAPNTQSAVSIAVGYHLATNKCGVVYLENSGLGAAIDVLSSVADPNVLATPMIVLVGIRNSETDKKHHLKNKTLTENLVKAYNTKYFVVSDNTNIVEEAHRYAMNNSCPVFILVDESSVSKSEIKYGKIQSGPSKKDAIAFIMSFLTDKDFLVSTTGNIAEHIYDIREQRKQSHNNDLLLLGALGNVSSVAYGLAINSTKNVYCIDDDGSFLYNLGGVTTAVQNTTRTMKYILIDDDSYASTGGQPAPVGTLDVKKMLKSMGFKNIIEAYTIEDMKVGMLRLAKEKSAMIIKVSPDKPIEESIIPDSPTEQSKTFQKEFMFDEKENKIFK